MPSHYLVFGMQRRYDHHIIPSIVCIHHLTYVITKLASAANVSISANNTARTRLRPPQISQSTSSIVRRSRMSFRRKLGKDTFTLPVHSSHAQTAERKCSLEVDSPPPKKVKLTKRLASKIQSAFSFARGRRNPSPTVHTSQPSISSSNSNDQRPPVMKNPRAHVDHDTGTASFFATRGFERELPPTQGTYPALHSRRWSIDASEVGLVRRWRIQAVNQPIGQDAEQFDAPPQLKRYEQVPIASRETDEPVYRRSYQALPDPLRYRELHRWGNIAPPRTEDRYIEVGDITITNNDFFSIIQMRYPDCWFRDTVLDIGLELVSLYFECAQNRICIASSLTAQCIRTAGDREMGDDMSDLSEYQAVFTDKDFIFVPLNDGYDGDPSKAGIHGEHWALLAVNRISGTSHYIDSLFKTSPDWQRLARQISRAISNLLGQPLSFRIEWHAPHQNMHNMTQSDDGPCGPFVLFMVKKYTATVRRMQNRGQASFVDFGLGPQTPNVISREFNSYTLRWDLVYTLAGARASKIADEKRREHDAAALAGANVEVVGLVQPSSVLYDAPLFDRDSYTRQCYEARARAKEANRVRDSSSPGLLTSESSSPVSTESSSDYQPRTPSPSTQKTATSKSSSKPWLVSDDEAPVPEGFDAFMGTTLQNILQTPSSPSPDFRAQLQAAIESSNSDTRKRNGTMSPRPHSSRSRSRSRSRALRSARSRRSSPDLSSNKTYSDEDGLDIRLALTRQKTERREAKLSRRRSEEGGSSSPPGSPSKTSGSSRGSNEKAKGRFVRLFNSRK